MLPGTGGGTAVKQDAAAPVKGRKLPAIAILDENFGFMDNGCLRHWKDGDVVTVPADIAQLIAHNAPLKDLGHG